jgi:hypothetical protein
MREFICDHRFSLVIWLGVIAVFSMIACMKALQIHYQRKNTHRMWALAKDTTKRATPGVAFSVYEDEKKRKWSLPLPVPDWTHKGLKDSSLFCYGCAHSAADKPFPSGPSGERPCGFCVRNRDLRNERKVPPTNYVEGFECRWYDGTPPLKFPADNYITVDRLDECRSHEKNWEEKLVKLGGVL